MKILSNGAQLSHEPVFEVVSGNAQSLASVPSATLFNNSLDFPIYHNLSNNNDNLKLVYCATGGAILTNRNGNTHFLSAGSTMFIRTDENWSMLMGRGDQSWLFSEWSPSQLTVPSETIIQTEIFLIGKCSTVVRELTEIIKNNSSKIAQNPNLFIAWLNVLIHEKHLSTASFTLTPLRLVDAEPISKLIDLIKSTPQELWNLTRAAEIAGYSPFHLSRTFRTIANMGFPEYVDRCRTEVAIRKLLEGAESMSFVAGDSGFGTPQAMRTAFREYTGFLPSEMKSHFDD
jgi:AraC-like DNA-binding protein